MSRPLAVGDISLSVDENGLWAIFTDNGYLTVAKINAKSLNIEVS